MNFENEDQVISLKTMAFAVLRQWKKMILAALILALALGLLRGITTWQELSDETYRSEAMEDYHADMEDYRAELERYEIRLERLRADIRHQQDYLKESVLMQMDYRNVYTATLGLYIGAQDPDVAAAIADVYRIALGSGSRMTAMAEAAGMDLRYLQELITVSESEDRASALITVTIRHASEDGARQLLELLTGELTAVEAEVRGTAGDHTLGILSGGVKSEVDLELSDLQEEENERLEDYTDELDGFGSEPLPPAEPDFGLGKAVKAAVIFAVLGGVVGVILVVVWACVAYILDDHVYSGEEIQGRLGLRLLGKLSLEPKKYTFPDRWLNRVEHRGNYNAPGELAMIAANVRNHAAGRTPILVSGSADSATVEAVVELLHRELPDTRILWAGSLLDSAVALERLPECGGILLVERCGASRYSAVHRQILAAAGVDKPIIGVIAAES